MFAARFACVTATPLGLAVEPAVNCANAMSAADCVTPSRIDGPCSASNGTTHARSGHVARRESMWGRSDGEVMTARALHERSTRAVASRYDGRSPAGAGG